MASKSARESVGNVEVYRKPSISFAIGEKIGSGAFGEVFKASENEKFRKGGRTLAVKYIKCRANKDLNDVIGEISALVILKHEHIVKLFDFGVSQYWQMEVEFSLIMEYCSLGNLAQHLDEQSPLNRKLCWIRNLISAVVYLHREGIVHQDLKPDNILVTKNDVLKVGDFGLARRFAHRREDQSWKNYYLSEGCGQRFYVAPEMLKDHHTNKVDIFSLGIIFHAIIERKLIKLQDQKYYGVFVGKDKPLGIEMYDKQDNVRIPFEGRRRKLIEKMLLYDAKKRPTAEEVQNIIESRWQRWRQLIF
ncbi:serine/threonine-protein kinase 35-like [Xenia sp. Carnegie-2017]|uniref:serine/threonine-protein kinase 35-like n=1 Tax=Xenia sp. Carnegie-2017 TaxID=2897299 RepID=UPI001F04BCDF|nr:serine/threonine-protein kinase 35-like [Xenia sp. Carnegie-2017]